jgi:hypothetical protein
LPVHAAIEGVSVDKSTSRHSFGLYASSHSNDDEKEDEDIQGSSLILKTKCETDIEAGLIPQVAASPKQLFPTASPHGPALMSETKCDIDIAIGLDTQATSSPPSPQSRQLPDNPTFDLKTFDRYFSFALDHLECSGCDGIVRHNIIQ